MSLSRLPISQLAALRLRIAGVTARIDGLSSRIRADMFALLRPFVVAEDESFPARAEVEIALRFSPAAASDAALDHDEAALEDDAGEESGEWAAWADGEQVFRMGVYDRLLRRLEWEVVSRSVDLARDWLAWHAASLAWEGRALLLIGASGAGKSTLTTALARRGWLPLADDLTLLDPQTGTLAPFPRCFHVAAMDGVWASSASALTWPTLALPDYAQPRHWARAGDSPTWIVVIGRDTTQPTRLTPLSQAQAAGALFGATIHTASTASAARLAATVAGASAGCWGLNNNDLETALDLLTTTLLNPSAGRMERARP
jgi:hypothetical protein